MLCCLILLHDFFSKLFPHRPSFDLFQDKRLLIIFILTSVWGARLSYNFFRKGQSGCR